MWGIGRVRTILVNRDIGHPDVPTERACCPAARSAVSGYPRQSAPSGSASLHSCLPGATHSLRPSEAGTKAWLCLLSGSNSEGQYLLQSSRLGWHYFLESSSQFSFPSAFPRHYSWIPNSVLASDSRKSNLQQPLSANVKGRKKRESVNEFKEKEFPVCGKIKET